MNERLMFSGVDLLAVDAQVQATVMDHTCGSVHCEQGMQCLPADIHLREFAGRHQAQDDSPSSAHTSEQ